MRHVSRAAPRAPLGSVRRPPWLSSGLRLGVSLDLPGEDSKELVSSTERLADPDKPVHEL